MKFGIKMEMNERQHGINDEPKLGNHLMLNISTVGINREEKDKLEMSSKQYTFGSRQGREKLQRINQRLKRNGWKDLLIEPERSQWKWKRK